MPTDAPNQSFEQPPTKPHKRRTSIENLKMEEAHANQNTDTHGSTRVSRLDAVKHHSSSLSQDIKDSIIDSRDQDGKHTSACNHSVLQK